MAGKTPSSHRYVGLAHVLLGDPTQTSGSGMTQLEEIAEVTVSPGIRTAFVSDGQRGGAPLSNGTYTLASQVEVNVSAKLAGIDVLEQLMPNATKTTSKGKTPTIGFPDKFEAIAQADRATLAIIPVTQEGDGSAAENGIWIPHALINGLDGFQYTRVEGGEINQPFSVSFTSAYRENDHSDTSIPSGNRMGWEGDPAVLSLSWSLPTLSS